MSHFRFFFFPQQWSFVNCSRRDNFLLLKDSFFCRMVAGTLTFRFQQRKRVSSRRWWFMWTPNLHSLSEWLFQHAALTLAIFATASAALLIGCALSAVCAPCKEKDRLFHRTVY
jgi:hypothetical protein